MDDSAQLPMLSSMGAARVIASASLLACIAACAPPAPKAAPSYPLIDTAIYDDRARELIRERGIELLAHGSQPAWWTSLTELSGNVATIPASGSAGDLQVGIAPQFRLQRPCDSGLGSGRQLSLPEIPHPPQYRKTSGDLRGVSE